MLINAGGWLTFLLGLFSGSFSPGQTFPTKFSNVGLGRISTRKHLSLRPSTSGLSTQYSPHSCLVNRIISCISAYLIEKTNLLEPRATIDNSPGGNSSSSDASDLESSTEDDSSIEQSAGKNFGSLATVTLILTVAFLTQTLQMLHIKRISGMTGYRSSARR